MSAQIFREGAGMDAQTTVDKLVDHLLGKGWYIGGSCGCNQANEIIFEEICRKYEAVDESPANKWRRKHKKCRWCHHCKSGGDYVCDVKQRYVNIDIPRPFCTVFELEPYSETK